MGFYDVNHNEGQHEKYPIELPSRNSKKEISPIVDVTEHEVYPLEFANCHRTKPHFDTNGDITEIVTTETEADCSDISFYAELRTDYPCSELMKTVRHNRNIGIKVVVLNNFH